MEEGRRKKEEGRREKEEGRGKKGEEKIAKLPITNYQLPIPSIIIRAILIFASANEWH
jgi:hypothetical protein